MYRLWWREDTEAGLHARWVVALSPEQAIRRFLRDQVPKKALNDGYEAVVNCREYGSDHRTRLYGVKIEEDRMKCREIPLPPFPELDQAIEKAVAEISELL